MSTASLSPAAERNKQPILEVLLRVLPAEGKALEIASGTGQHVAWFAAAMPRWIWQPTDADPQALAAIAACVREAGVANVRPPVHLDVTAAHWPSDASPFEESFEAIYCANMLHISPWATCSSLMQGARRHLTSDGVLVTYGPYLEDDVTTSPGNLAFDQSLRSRNPACGIRHLRDVKAQAQIAGLALRERHAMPANNLLLVFARQA